MKALCAGISIVATLALAGPAAAAVKPLSTSEAQDRLEVEYTYVDQDIVRAAKTKLAEAIPIGSPTAIAEARALVQKAKAGMSVTRAACLGMKRYSSGFLSFRCKLRLRDAIGFTATMRGLYARNAVTGRWKWTVTSYLRDEV